MKYIYLICLFAFVHTANAQDFCSQIKKDVSEDKTIFDFTSPFDPVDPPPMRVGRSYSTNPEYRYDNFIVTFQIPCELDSIYTKTEDGTQAERDEHSIVVEFEDHSKITDEALKITHDFTQDRSQALRVVYYTLTDKTTSDFSNKKIIKFTLSRYSQAVPPDVANAFMHYVACIKAMK